MTKQKTTKRMLLTSILSLALCILMLLGSTFAWFTDTVTSGNNIIKSGNLDIDVEYTLDGDNWNNLDGADDLFQKGLWEPGHTEVVALRIKNNGTLALKYAASMNIIDEIVGKNKDGANIVLSDILTVSTLVQQSGMVGDITVGLAFSGENSVSYENTTTFKAGNVLREDKELAPGDAHYLIIKVDMAETVGNEANHNGTNIPSIDFGIKVLATQYTSESDSFGNQYDKDAEYANVDVISINNWSNVTLTVNATNNTLNANKATPYTYDPAKGETEADSVKIGNVTSVRNYYLFDTLSGGYSTINESDTVLSGDIAIASKYTPKK